MTQISSSTFFTKAAFLFVALVSFLTLTSPQPLQAAPPAEFEKTLVAGELNQPTAFKFMPDGRIFIAEKAGAIKIVENGVISPNPVVTIVVLETDAADERGLLGLEPDPNFETNGYLYVAYTAANNRDRLSRITVVGDSADLGSEVILLESDQDSNVFHHGGELMFGPDGYLYWALGMNTINVNSQLLNNVHGKIHRLNPDGSIPADNPFISDPNVLPSIWAYGLRNPFRFDFLPNGKIILGDVGGYQWEEVNIIDKGANYGWPLVEGICTGCGYANPLFAYPHTPEPENAGSITSALYYGTGIFPPEFDNSFFYGDYTLGFIRYLKLDETQESVLSDNLFDGDAGTVVQLSEGPDGNFYQLNFFPGELYKIALSDGNRAPIAVAAANPIAGDAPLEVTFSSEGSYDPDETTLMYAWDFGDGNTSIEANPTNTYTTDGEYTATLSVSDGEKVAQDTVLITVGNNLPQPTITSPIADSNYNAGDTITFTGTATDPEDGDLPDSAYTWDFRFHHGTHHHPFLQTITGTKTGTFDIPTGADNVYNTWYAIVLTVEDSSGLKNTTTTNIYPNLVDLTFTTNTPGAQYKIDGIPYSDTHIEQAVVGVERALSAMSPQFINNVKYRYESWSDGGAETHTITTPPADSTYQANYFAAPLPSDPWEVALIDAQTSGDSWQIDDEYTIMTASPDIWADGDGMYYVYQTLDGDGEIVTRVTSQTFSTDWAKAGVMIKESATQHAAYAMMAVTPDFGYTMQWQYANGVDSRPYEFPNAWVKLVREGDLITGFTSPDGETWTEMANATIPMTQQVTVGMFHTTRSSSITGTATFDNVSVNGPIVEPGPLPAPWQTTDVGAPALAGSSTVVNDAYTLEGGGDDIWGTTDQFHYAYQTLDGDGTITARVTSQTNTNDWAKAGVMIKDAPTALSPYALMAVTPSNGIRYQANFSQEGDGGTYTFPDAWVRLQRVGNVVTGYTSADGLTWTEVTSRTVALGSSATYGLYVTSHDGSALSTVTFDNVSFEVGAPTSGLPTGWTNTDVGGPDLAGTTTYDSTAEAFTVHGAGHDIWADVDQFQYAYQPLDGDGEIVARVTAQTNTNDWAKAGVMMKQSTTGGDDYVMLAATPVNGLRMQYNFTGEIGGGTHTLPVWVKLVRQGDKFTSFRSTDGVTWALIGSTNVVMTPQITVGLFTTSHNGSVLGSATFDNVSIGSSTSTALPAEWSNQDIGDVGIAGDATYDNGVFTIGGGGYDIWEDRDDFHYVYQPLAGDGTITARVISQGNTNDWAKAGVMIKETTTQFAQYAFMGVTPVGGYRFQWDFLPNSTGAGDYTFPDAWVRLTREGDVISGYTSPDGVTWTMAEQQTVPMAADVTIGLFVTSHNFGTLSTASFDNVVVE